MLTIRVGETEAYDEEKQEFVKVGGTPLHLEHSLVSLSKWESIHEEAFLGSKPKTPEQVLSYIECMVVGEIPRGEIFQELTEANIAAINAYIDRKMTATWFSDQPGVPRTREIITSELIYYWMTAFHIPFECETWHLNRLFTLIRICNIKQDNKPKKMSRAEVAERNRKLNKERQQQFGTKG